MRDYRGMQFNHTFRGCDPGDYNACVGNNGQPSYTEYANGYVDAAIHLIDIAIENEAMDELIYPICFNMRHAIELRLKQFVFALGFIRDSVDLNDFRDASMHDLGEIWRYYKNKASKVDSRISAKLIEFESIINDFAVIDPTGQVFRYPYSTGKKKHLTEVSLINVVNLKREFERLRGFLDEVHQLNNALALEYQTGTYTNLLSRADLDNISDLLPQHSRWVSDKESCLIIKSKIMTTYLISSAEFGRAKRMVESHYQFAKKIGIDIPLRCSTVFDWLKIFEAWMSVNEVVCPELPSLAGVITGSEITVDAMLDDLRQMNDAEVYCLQQISVEAFIDIFCVYECGRYGDYCEYYCAVYKNEIQFAGQHRVDVQQRREYINYLLSKNNFMQYAVKGLKMLRQEEILSALAEKYILDA